MISSHFLRGICAASLIGCFSMHAQAIPKAAEHEDAPVTTAADVAKPKPSAKTVAPKKAAKKSVHKASKSRKANQKVVAPGKSKHRKR